MRGDRYCGDGFLVQGDAEEREWVLGGRDRRTSGGEDCMDEVPITDQRVGSNYLIVLFKDNLHRSSFP